MLHSTDADGYLTHVSDYWCRQLGYCREDVIGKKSVDFLTEESRHRALGETLPRFFETGRCDNVPYQILTKQQEIRDVLLSAVAERDSEGEISRSIAVMIDVTEHKRALTDRKQAESKLLITQFSVDHAADAVFWIDRDAQFVYVNDEACRSLGYSREELTSMRVHDISAIEHEETWSGFWQRLQKQRFLEIESVHRRNDGHEFPVEIRSSFLDTEETQLVCVFARDITEKKHALTAIQKANTWLEERVRQRTEELETKNAALAEEVVERGRAEKRFRDLLESAPDGMVIISRQGEIILVNRQTESLFGYLREELFHQPIELLVPETYRPQHPQLVAGYFSNPTLRRMGRDQELIGRRKDGTTFPIEISLSPIFDANGIAVAAAVRDVSDRHRAERLLQSKQEELAHVTRLATMGEMAAGLAHELN